MMLKRNDKLLQKELESTDAGPSSTETAPAKNWVQDTPLWMVGTAIAIALGAYHFATSFVGIPQAWLHRAIHMMLVLLLAYISFGKVKKPIRYLEKGITVGFLCLAFVYILVYYNDIQLRAAFPTTLDLVIGTGLVALVIVACWRYVGPAMAWVIIAFCLYAVLGFLLPGRLKAPQLTFPYMISYLFNSNFALMGSTTGVAATSVVMFVFFGALLDKSGAMKVFSDISIMATRRITGGPAKASVIACALVGMIQGNSITNVATTGTFAIPLMKRAGYSKEFAGAVEATAATGGMIMPPVMGAAAFLMAEYTSTPYSKIIVYAIVPALLYYLGVFLAVHLRALRWDLKPVELELSLSKKEMLWQGLTCLAGFLTLIVMLVAGFSATRSALFATLALTLVWAIRPVDRLTLRGFLKAVESGGRGMLSVSTACVGAGIVVGCIGMTGLGIKISVLASIVNANVWAVLIMSMVVCIILGMGLPVTASYVLAATTLSSVLTGYGLELIPVHMFLLYFATMSAITPPVALASYAAAGIADASPNKVGWQGLVLVLPSFLVPFVFIFNQELLLIGNGLDIILAVLSASAGIFAFSIITEGWIFGKVPTPARVLLGVAVVCLLMVGVATDLIGYVILAAVVLTNYMAARKRKKELA